MEAIRQTVKVKNHSFKITLPDNFNADEVDVIIMAKKHKAYEIPQWQINQVRERHDAYMKNLNLATNVNDFLKELEREI